MSANAAAVERLLEALRKQDLDAFAAELDPEVEVEGLKGSFKGIDAVRRWATPSPDGDLRMRIEVDELREVGDEFVALDARRQWRWPDGELAEEAPFGALFELRDGKVVSWRQRFDSIVDAIEAVPRRG